MTDETPGPAGDPDYSECLPGKPKRDADYHEAMVRVSKSPERYRCETCGQEWAP